MRKFIQSPVVGGVLLISGTTLGAGMLAFPALTSYGGFLPSAILFLLIWLLMLTTAFFFLDANLAIPGKCNMVSMAEEHLGLPGKLLSWVVYLLLLYALTAAYIAGCTPLIVEVVKAFTGYTLPGWFAPFSLPLLFGSFIYSGTRGVDLINRVLMLGLVVSYFLLVFFVPGQVSIENLSHIDFPAITIAIPVVITAFGYHIIIPSLTTYLGRDRKLLRKTILIGSCIPIIVYLLWQVLVLGAVPIPLLSKTLIEGHSATDALAGVLHNPLISLAAKFFSFFAIVTSFVGVTLSLADFLIDGFKIKKGPAGRFWAILLTFIPPLFFVFTYQRGFYVALQYAGAFVAILLVFLPAAMVWKLKNYHAKRILILFVMLVAIGIVGLDILQQSGKLDPLISKYTTQ